MPCPVSYQAMLADQSDPSPGRCLTEELATVPCVTGKEPTMAETIGTVTATAAAGIAHGVIVNPE